MSNTELPSAHEDVQSMPEEGIQQELRLRAHQLWIARGCPLGSPEEDWLRAERELRREAEATTAVASTASSGHTGCSSLLE